MNELKNFNWMIVAQSARGVPKSVTFKTEYRTCIHANRPNVFGLQQRESHTAVRVSLSISGMGFVRIVKFARCATLCGGRCVCVNGKSGRYRTQGRKRN